MIDALKHQSGWLTLQKLCIESLDRHEELVFTAIKSDGTVLDQESCEKLFICAGEEGKDTVLPIEVTQRLAEESERRTAATLNRVMERNNTFFREEHLRIDKWADDMLLAAEKELKDTRQLIKATGRQLRLAETVDEQAQLQKKELALTRKRRKLRNKLDDVEDAIEDKARTMRHNLQARLRQTVETETIFTIEWAVI